jgi:TonB family protein
MSDSRQVIEVTSVFDDSVVAVRHLLDPQGGRIKPMSWGLLGIGGLGIALGVISILAGQPGLGGIELMLGVGTLVVAGLRMVSERRSPHFIVGECDEADLPLPRELVGAARFPLVQSDGNRFSLLFNRQMSGDVSLGGQLKTLSELADAGFAKLVAGSADTYAYPIPADARALVQIGEHRLLVNSVPAAQQVDGGLFTNFSWSRQVFTGLSLAGHAVLLMIVLATPPSSAKLDADMFGKNNKFVAYLNKPEEERSAIPKWMRDTLSKQPKAEARAGQKAPGHKGKMGKKDAPRRPRHIAIKGNADRMRIGKDYAKEAVKNAGLLKFLAGQKAGSPIASLFGKDSALGQQAIDAMGNLSGDGPGEAYGTGGLGLTSDGRGGGHGDCPGCAGPGLQKVGDIGPGKMAGSPKWAGIPTRLNRTPRVPKIGIGDVIRKGGLSKAIIRRTVRRHLNEVKYCYQRELQGNRNLRGRVIVSFTISGNGRVAFAGVKRSTLGNVKVEGCIAKAVRRWLFPAPQGGGIVMVSYPFVLHTSK